jgi:enoyl-CoA hydratase
LGGDRCRPTGIHVYGRVDAIARRVYGSTAEDTVTELLLIERRDAIATLTLNRPEKKNALSIGVRDEIADAIDELAADETVKVIVITGAGDTFSAGFDLKEFQQATGDAEFGKKLWASSDRYHGTVLTCPLPTVAAVNGAALAGGFDLAIMCDIRVAAEEAYFAHPERTFGDVVYGPLHDLVGGAVARDLTMTGRRIDAREALSLRVVSAVVPRERLLEEATRVAGEIAQAPRPVLLRLKAKALRRAGVEPGRTLDL